MIPVGSQLPVEQASFFHYVLHLHRVDSAIEPMPTAENRRGRFHLAVPPGDVAAASALWTRVFGAGAVPPQADPRGGVS